MMDVSCDLCGADECREVGVGLRFGIEARVVVCLQCGLAYQNPRMNDGELAAFYRDTYRGVYSGNNAEPAQEFIEQQTAHGRRVRDRVTPYLSPPATILDVGCGPGGMLLPFREAGYSVVGIEPGPYAQWGRTRLSLDVREAPFESADLDDVRVDAIILSFVLEHVSSPTAILRRAHELLRDEGILYVEVPNLWSIRGPVTKYFHVAHLTYFSPPTLVGILRKCGFQHPEVIAGSGYGLAVVAKRSQGASVTLPVEEPAGVIGMLQRHSRVTAAQEFVKTLLRPAGSAVSVAARLVGGREAELRLQARARKAWARARYGD
jgi:2-polyprenyl-3-methyl-5-hydroxy-6-metoxy-1,4-benzoquinol methylase